MAKHPRMVVQSAASEATRDQALSVRSVGGYSNQDMLICSHASSLHLDHLEPVLRASRCL